jgi:hypothetical protein
MTTEKPAQGRHWLLEVLSPLTLHLTGIILIYLFTLVVRLRSAFLRKVIALALFNSIIFFGYLKTSSDPNLFRVLHTARTPSIKDIQMGLDRLELTMDEDTVAEMENKLTGKASSYYLKGKGS